MRLSITSLFLTLTATLVLASPKLQEKRKTNSTTSGGCEYHGLLSPSQSTSTIWTSCICDPAIPRAWVYNLTAAGKAEPPCTPRTVDYATSRYPSVEFFGDGNPAVADCATWEAEKGGENSDGTPVLVQPYTGLCG